VDQPLLRTVVQIADHAPALVVGHRHDSRPRRRRLRPRFGVRDRSGDQFGEVLQARLGVRRERFGLLRVDRKGAPQAPLDNDRAADGGTDPELVPDEGGDRPGDAVPVVDPRWAASLGDQHRRIAFLGRPASRELWVLAHCDPGRYRSHRVLGLVADHPREVRAQEPADLRGDGPEELVLRHTPRDECRHPPQRGLLLGEPSHLHPGFGVRDRRRDELGEGGDPRLGVRRERLVVLG
jgi:hypothetical protein